MSYLINYIRDGKLNGSFNNAINGWNSFSDYPSYYTSLTGHNYSFDKTKGHPFFVDSCFSLNESSINLSISSMEIKGLGERSDYFKVGVH